MPGSGIIYVFGTGFHWLETPTKQTFPHNRIFASSKLKTFADNVFVLSQMVKFLFDWVGNTMGKGENAGYQHFLLLSQCFQKASS